MSPRPAVVFVACNKNAARYQDDPSFRYRCDNLAGGLARRGWQVRAVHLSELGPALAAGRPDVLVFHRPIWSLRLAWWLARLRHRPVRLVADVDDLIFDPDLAAYSPAVRNGLDAEGTLRRRFRANRRALTRFPLLTTSTEVLAQALAALPGRPAPAQVLWLPNAVHCRWQDLPAVPASPEPVLRYLPGTRSHDRDFALIAGVLSDVLRARPQARLDIVGPLSVGLDLPPGQVRLRPRVPFEDYAPCVAGARVNLAPLEDTPFNHAKSALKVIEAGFWGVPTVCSPLPDARRFVGRGACVAASPAEWRHWLTRLLDEPDFHAAQVQDLRRRVLAEADIDVQAARWEAALGLGAGGA